MARRRKGATQALAGPGTRACPLCGEVVPVGEDGRCDLGHRVFTPAAAFEGTQPLGHVEVLPPDDGGVGVPVAPVAGLAAAGLALADTEGMGDDEDTLRAAEETDESDDEAPPDLSAELDW